MKVYFPIPPNIKIKNIKEKIISSITFLNIPNNRLKSFFYKKYEDKVFLGIYHLKNNKWLLLKIKECLPLEFIEITRKELDVTDTEMVVVVPKKIKIFEKETIALPEPDSLKIDNSIVAQRVSLNFSFLNFSTSFQGEYPYSMACLKNSSFLSLDTLKGMKHKHLKSFLILMNISKDLNTKDSVRIKSFNPNKKDRPKIFYANKNSYTIHETTIYEKDFKEETIFYTSEICSFIPIILSINLKTNQLSVEHIHPPTEYFFGSRKEELVKSLKKQWIN